MSTHAAHHSQPAIMRFFLIACLATSLLCAAPIHAQEQPVDLELVLAVDVSGSMDADEKLLQRQGYVEAFRHPQVIRAIVSGFHGGIAVTYVEWAGPSSQVVILPWRSIDREASAEDFARDLAAAPTSWIRRTSISGALLFSAALFDDNGFEAPRRVIDISGDGPNNTGSPVLPVRDAVVEQGIVINGLPITLKSGGFGGLQPGQLDLYYEECVIGGTGAFIVSVQDPQHLAEAIRRKLVLEIAGAPPRATPAAAHEAGPRIDCLIGEKTRPSWLDEDNR
ncbi:MAG TPA: DUF1194 domain-containing protein [Alphaproteobacteria bacterium]|nr:DUF1194 domain-containing protein [Alphaproteobacteria bacterium]